MCHFLCNVVFWSLIGLFVIPVAVFVFDQAEFWLLISILVVLKLLNRINPMIK